ncbi:sensor histidine kinase [Streptomonospora litoralis]|uniref:histidine kinase n=1 Tax=Streptomonospora litoralis TaxID=2498135 RepID=A0A4P6Q7W2_9ACTN|nr:histidine kinase [Streptomonospora litoralis]QBI55229.1 Sensor histidine kinase DesK [Streptomonospora litoralis]
MRQLGAAAIRAGREVVRPLAGRPTLRSVALDLLLWAALCLPVALELTARSSGVQAPSLATPAEAVIGSAVLATAIAVSRPFPIAGALLVLVLSESVAPSFLPAVWVLCYLLGLRDPRVWLAGAACGVAAAALAVRVAADPQVLLDVPGMLITYVFAIVLPWMVGSYRRQRKNLDDAGWERARNLEREQRIAADQARLRERSRIAQDMHDSLGHELSLIALRAGALELAPDLADRHRNAAGELRESATTATERLREIVGVLRESGEDAPTAPTAPAGEEIAEVVDRARRSGVEVVLERSGDWEAVAPMVDRAAHRVVQEGITNATKHAPGAPVRVVLERAADETVVTVANNAPPAAAAQPAESAESARGGRGLVGLGERVRLSGGSLEAGARGGGFTVVARFTAAGGPAGADAADPAGEAESFAADEQMRAAQRGLRRRTLQMAAAAVVLLICGAGFAAGGTYLRLNSATLEPDKYAGLRLGAPLAQVEPELPWQQYDPAAERDDSAAAGRYDCRYYRSYHGFPGGEYSVYRLCFGGGELVAKDSLPELGPYPDADP